MISKILIANRGEIALRVILACKEMGYIETRTSKAPYDAKAGRFLPDRYVEGTCPHCGKPGARGDQCDACGKTLDPKDLKDPVSKLSPGNPVRNTLIRSLRWIPGMVLFESGTFSPYSAWMTRGSSGSCTAGRNCASFCGSDPFQ